MGEMQLPPTPSTAPPPPAPSITSDHNLRFCGAFLGALPGQAAAQASMSTSACTTPRSPPPTTAPPASVRRPVGRRFPIDIFQTGSATSTNKNANDVIATRAAQLDHGYTTRTQRPRQQGAVEQRRHPDGDPRRLRAETPRRCCRRWSPAGHLREARRELQASSKNRPHPPVGSYPFYLSAEIRGWANPVQLVRERMRRPLPRQLELAQVAPPAGSGSKLPLEFGQRSARAEKRTGLPFRETRNHFAAQAAQYPAVEVAAAKALAAGMMKIAIDLRLLTAVPQAGLERSRSRAAAGVVDHAGKVKPVIASATMMVCGR